MRMKAVIAIMGLLAVLPTVGHAEEIRMIGQSVMFSTNSITSNVIESRTHKTLIKAFKSVGLEQPLMKKGNYTVFAPDDAAFASLPPKYADRLFQRVNRDQMAKVLACHIIADNEHAGKRFSELLASADTVQLQTLGGCTLTISRKAGAFHIAGVDGLNAIVTAADIKQSNGMVQIINQVIAPPID